MTTLALSEVDERTRELIEKVARGDEVVFTDQNRPVARMVGVLAPRVEIPPPAKNRRPLIYKTFAMGLKGKPPTGTELAEEMFDHK